MNINSNENIIFDLDDTLINTSSTIFQRIFLLFQDYNIQEGAMYVYNLLQEPKRVKIMAERYDFAEQFWHDYEKLRSSIRPAPIGNLKGKLESFLRKGYNMGILTRARTNKVKEFLKNAMIKPELFSLGIYTSDNSKRKKPKEGCFTPILSRCSTGETFYCGDNLEDMNLAQQADLGFLAVCTGLTTRQDFLYKGLNESRVFRSVLEVQLR